tara:strand:- start:1826 stop:3475 length:1650 start_codon:yes stop_codon:yes gene_type:complete
MAYKNITRKEILRKIGSKAVRDEMEHLLDTGMVDYDGKKEDPIWRYDEKDERILNTFGAESTYKGKGGKAWSYLKPRTLPKTITLKSSQMVIEQINKRYKTLKSVTEGAPGKNTASIQYVRIGIQWFKLEATGETTDRKGKTISDTTMTRIQELCTAWVIKRALDVGGFNSIAEIRKDEETMKVLNDIWVKIGHVDLMDTGWLYTFFEQQKALLAKLGGCCYFKEYSRDGHKDHYILPGMNSAPTFMDWVSDLVAGEPFNIKGKDNWNPADIWLIKREDHWRKVIEKAVKDGRKGSPIANIEQLNHIFRILFNTHQIMGISLKKIGPGQTAKVDYVNISKAQVEAVADFNFEVREVTCKLDCKKDKEGKTVLASQDTRFIVYDKSHDGEYNFQIKGNNSTSLSGLKYEPTEKGRGAARMGKATVELVERNLNDYKVGHLFKSGFGNYPKDADAFDEKEMDKWEKKIDNLLLQKEPRCEMQVESGKKGVDNIAFAFNGSAPVANAKLQQIEWLTAFYAIKNKDDRDKFGTDMVFLAKKEGARYGPFAKVY